jgi:hypothetical protein
MASLFLSPALNFAGVVVTGDKVIAGVVVTGDKLFTGINDTGDN